MCRRAHDESTRKSIDLRDNAILDEYVGSEYFYESGINYCPTNNHPKTGNYYGLEYSR